MLEKHIANFFNLIALLLLLTIIILLIKNRKKVERESIVFIWKTKFGLKFIEKKSKFFKKHKTFTDFLVYFMLFTSLISLIYITYYLIKSSFKLLTKQTNIPGISLVIPGVTKIGDMTIPFWTIIILFLIILIHEFGHGLFAKIYNLKVKSTGLVLLGIIPGAFVELDDKELEKKKMKEKLAILMAGPFFNIVVGTISLGLLFLINLFSANFIDYKGVYYESFANNSLNKGILYSIDNYPINSIKAIGEVTKNKKIGDIVILNTSEGIKEVKLINYSNFPAIGIKVWQDCSLSFNPNICSIISFLKTFLIFFFVFNLGIGLANLLPFFFLDGGRALYYIMKELKLLWVYLIINIFVLILILLNLFYPLYSKFL